MRSFFRRLGWNPPHWTPEPSHELRVRFGKAGVRPDTHGHSRSLQVPEPFHSDRVGRDLRGHHLEPERQRALAPGQDSGHELDTRASHVGDPHRGERPSALPGRSHQGAHASRLDRVVPEGERQVRHGTQVQGDLEGEPGRDPEVHHQGSDHPLIRAPRAPRLAFLLALASCSSPPPVDEDRPSSNLKPREGTIVYHEPESVGLRKGRSPETTFIFTTASKGMAEDEGYEIRTGQLGDSKNAGDVARELLKPRTGIARVLTPARFAELWARLEETGLFELPPYRGSQPPANTEHITVQSGKSRRTYVRPEIADPPRPDDPGVTLLKIWVAAELAILEYVNET